MLRQRAAKLVLRRPTAVRNATRAAATAASTATFPAVARLNDTLEQYPATSFAVHIGSSLGTFSLACAILQGVGFDAPALAVAGIVSRLTKRLRTPVDFSIAAALANAMPAANQLKLGPLLAAPLQVAQPPPPPPPPQQQAQEGQNAQQQQGQHKRGQAQSDAPADGPILRLERGLISFTQWAQGPVNAYGGPYMLVHWSTGLLTVSLTTAAVHNGLDVVALLSSVPFLPVDQSSVQYATGKASCVAGAMTINTLSLPIRLYLLSLYGKPVFAVMHHHGLRSLRSWHRANLRIDRSLARLETRDAGAGAGDGAGAPVAGAADRPRAVRRDDGGT